MKNKTIILLVLVSLLALPAVAAAATEFSLGGYLKLEMWWDSAALNKNIAAPPPRNNDPNGQHGRFNATAQSSRFSFTIKGPDIWGAKTTGYLEVDFDKDFEARQTASHAYGPRLRHAFFRLNWPETELLFGQYWSMFCEFYPELIQDGPYQGHGVATHRLAQARVTQLFGVGPGKLRLAALIGKPTDTNDSLNVSYPILPATPASPLEGQTSETPQFQGLIQWEGDLWGKAGFYGAPRGFTAQVVGGWQRSRYRVTRTSGFNLRDQEYTNNWMVQGTLFIPVIPTATKNLAGTMAFTAQAYVGQGLDAFGNVISGTNSYLVFPPGLPQDRNANVELTKTWGGYLQANYYFTNQWFVNAAVGYAQNFGIDGRTAENFLPASFVHNWWEADLTLYYRPITALKFGLQYLYTRADYYRATTVQTNTTNIGEAHSVRFGTWFFF